MIKPTAIDLFCGAGGLSEGLRQAGFEILAGNDINQYAAETFSRTHPDSRFLKGSIYDISATDFLNATGLNKGELYCLAGGPPCQGYSVYNHQRGMHDDRSHLFKEYLRIIEGLMPRWIIMENVTGIMSAGEGEAFQAVLAGIRGLGYNVQAKTLRAEDYGVPQERRRVVFIGNCIGAPIVWPRKSHGHGLKPFNTVRDAIFDLPRLLNGEERQISNYAADPSCDYQRELRKGSLAA